MRIAIIGYSGSGKSTAAQKLGEKYGIPVLHMDTVYWRKNWSQRPAEECRRIVNDFMESNTDWVIDGNYKKLYQTERFDRADIILFFSFNRYKCLYNIVKRYIKYHGTSRPDIAEGCNEKIDWEFIRWVFADGRTVQKRKAYENMCKKYSNKVVILKTKSQVDDFIKKL